MKYLALIVSFVASAAVFLIALANANDSAARRAYAHAAIIREQSQARQDFLAAALPYLIFGTVAIAGIGLSAAVIYALSRRPDEPQIQRVIERQIVILIQPGQSRREVYQLLSKNELGQ